MFVTQDIYSVVIFSGFEIIISGLLLYSFKVPAVSCNSTSQQQRYGKGVIKFSYLIKPYFAKIFLSLNFIRVIRRNYVPNRD
jgi:hypothetical protein